MNERWTLFKRNLLDFWRVFRRNKLGLLGGFLVLTAGDSVLRLAPPLVVTESEAERALAILDSAFATSGP